MKKFLLSFFLSCVVLVAIAVILLLKNLNSLIQSTLETTGTEMLGEPVRVGAVDLSLRSGAGEIRKLRIDNPEGYTDAEAFSMQKIRMNLDVQSVTGSPIRLEEFIIEAPEVYLEVRDDNRVNLEELARNLKAKIDAKKEETPSREPNADPDDQQAEDTLLAITHLRIAGVKLTLRHRKFEEGVKEVTLPDIDLKNVGGSEGITGPEIGLKVVEEITKEGLKQTLRAEVEKQAGRLLQKGLEKLQESDSED